MYSFIEVKHFFPAFAMQLWDFCFVMFFFLREGSSSLVFFLSFHVYALADRSQLYHFILSIQFQHPQYLLFVNDGYLKWYMHAYLSRATWSAVQMKSKQTALSSTVLFCIRFIIRVSCYAGQARLAFLLDIFEEDLSRHRHNLNTLARVQQRYNAEQFNEVMRLESELGQITANLLHLIDSECLISWLIFPLCIPLFGYFL